MNVISLGLDCLTEIFQYCNDCDVGNFLATCKNFHEVRNVPRAMLTRKIVIDDVNNSVGPLYNVDTLFITAPHENLKHTIFLKVLYVHPSVIPHFKNLRVIEGIKLNKLACLDLMPNLEIAKINFAPHWYYLKKDKTIKFPQETAERLRAIELSITGNVYANLEFDNCVKVETLLVNARHPTLTKLPPNIKMLHIIGTEFANGIAFPQSLKKIVLENTHYGHILAMPNIEYYIYRYNDHDKNGVVRNITYTGATCEKISLHQPYSDAIFNSITVDYRTLVLNDCNLHLNLSTAPSTMRLEFNNVKFMRSNLDELMIKEIRARKTIITKMPRGLIHLDIDYLCDIPATVLTLVLDLREPSNPPPKQLTIRNTVKHLTIYVEEFNNFRFNPKKLFPSALIEIKTNNKWLANKYAAYN